MTAKYYHEGQDLSRPAAPESGGKPPGFQLVHPDIAGVTRPDLFDDLPAESLTEDHLLIRNASGRDRMLIVNQMRVPLSARLVANTLLYHGWAGSPSREVLGQLSGIKGYQNVARAVSALERAGILVRRRIVLPGRGYAGNSLVFSGFEVCRPVGRGPAGAAAPFPSGSRRPRRRGLLRPPGPWERSPGKF